MAKSVWALKDDDAVIPVYGDETTDPRLWLFNLSDTLSQEQFVEVLVTLWAIWWARRRAIHEEEFQSPLSTHLFIIKYLNDLNLMKMKEEGGVKLRRSGCLPWIPPPQGLVKLNVDGAVAKSSNIGASVAVCRDETGMFLGASAFVMQGIMDPATLEACACREALALAADLNVSQICVASDCKEVVYEINQTNEARGDYCMVIKEIRGWRENF